MDRHEDARRRVVGTLPLAVNERPPGALAMRLVRSTAPHARIRRVDVSGASALDGVVAVLTGQDLVDDPESDPFFGPEVRDRPALAVGVVRYVGEPVAAVIAMDDETAEAAANLIWPELDELPSLTSTVEAREADAVTLHPDAPGNLAATWTLHRGDPDTVLETCDHVFDDVYTSPAAAHVPLEPHVCVATWADGRLDLLTTSQAPYAVREAVTQVLKLPEDAVRVRVQHLGGAFGAKVDAHIEPIVAIAARRTNATVRLELQRDEVFQTVTKRAATVRLTTGVTAEGQLLARRVEVDWNVGAYATSTPGSTGHGMVRAPGPYRIPDVAVTSRAVYTNTVPSGPFRGAMTSQLCWAYESQMDDIAARLDLDPVEVRRRNVLVEGDTYATGEPLHDIHFRELLDELVDGIGWKDAPAPARDPSRVRGRGLALMIKSTVTPSRSEADLAISNNGQVRLGATAVDMGQGVHRVLTDLVARLLDVPVTAVDLVEPDTTRTPYDTMTASSRTAFTMSEAVEDAVRSLTREIVDALDDRGIDAEADGAGHLRLADGSTLSLPQALRTLGRLEARAVGVHQSIDGVPSLDPDTGQGVASAHWHQGGAAVEVEIDTETGTVDVVRLHGTSWAGRILDAVNVRKQNEGSAIFALGPALFEQLIYDGGQLVNPNMSDYLIPSILDIPSGLTSRALEHDRDDAEVHGVGEMVAPAVAPAIGNAIRDALGIRIVDLPMTAERVLRALHDTRHGSEDLRGRD